MPRPPPTRRSHSFLASTYDATTTCDAVACDVPTHYATTCDSWTHYASARDTVVYDPELRKAQNHIGWRGSGSSTPPSLPVQSMKAFVLFVLRRFAGTLARQLLAVAMVGIVLFITFVFFISLSRFAWVEIYPYRYVALLEADGLSIVRRGELDPLGHANIDNDIALEYEISRPHYKIRARTVARPPAQTGLVELDYWAVVTLEAFANDDSPLTIQELDTKHRCAVLTDYPAQYHQPQVFSPAVKVMNWKPDNLWPQYNEQAARHHEACTHPDNAIIHFQVNDTDGRAVGSEKLHYTIARGGSHTPSLAGR